MSETFPTAEKNTKEKEVSAQETLRQSPDAAQQPELTAQIVGNPRIKEMIAQRDAAQRQLNDAILDLYDREKSPAFQEAKRLFDEGWRCIPFGERARVEFGRDGFEVLNINEANAQYPDEKKFIILSKDGRIQGKNGGYLQTKDIFQNSNQQDLKSLSQYLSDLSIEL
jgi:hypothetical protein